MKKTLMAGIVTGMMGLMLAPQVLAEENTKTISGETSTDIEVIGTLGADNTDPDAPIIDGDSNWINVTVPMKTVFYNTVKDVTIKSPTYEIVNNSGRPVKVSNPTLKDATGDENKPEDFTLNLNINDQVINLITAGQIKSNTDTEMVTLANGKDSSGKNKANFTYSGKATVKEKQIYNYNLNLTFESVK